MISACALIKWDKKIKNDTQNCAFVFAQTTMCVVWANTNAQFWVFETTFGVRGSTSDVEPRIGFRENPLRGFRILKGQKSPCSYMTSGLMLKKLHYEERLRRLKLPTLKYRMIRGDMIELYKIFAGKYDNNTTECNVLKNNMIQEIIDLHYNSHTFTMICVNLIFQIGLSQDGIVYQIMLLLLLP